MKQIILLLISLCSVQWLGAQENITDSLAHQDLMRIYIVHTPPNYDPDEALPLVMVLHGGSGSAVNAMNFTQMNTVSDAEGFLAVYPQGYGPTGAGFSWADGRGVSADQLGIDDVGFLDKLLDTLAIDYAVDSERIYICGFSNGGFMTQRLACEANDRFAAIASLGCTMDEPRYMECQPERPIPMLLLGGTADPLVPYYGGPMNNNVPDIVPMDSVFAFYAEQNNCNTALEAIDLPDIDQTDNSTVTKLAFTDCDCDADVLLYQVNDGGHTWPGVENVLYELIAGETNEDIQASVELWDFFSQHSLCDETVSTQAIPPKELKLQLSPNPTVDWVQITTSQSLRNIIVYNQLGQIVQHITVNGTSAEVNLQPFSAGMYFFGLHFQDGQLRTKAVIKR